MASGDNVVEIDEHDGMTATEAGLEMFQKFRKKQKISKSRVFAWRTRKYDSNLWRSSSNPEMVSLMMIFCSIRVLSISTQTTSIWPRPWRRRSTWRRRWSPPQWTPSPSGKWPLQWRWWVGLELYTRIIPQRNKEWLFSRLYFEEFLWK